MPVFPGKRVAAAWFCGRTMFAPTRSAPVPTITTKNFSRQEHRLLLALFYPHRPFRASKSRFCAESLAISVCEAYTFRKNAQGCLTVKTIPQKLAAPALVCALAVSLADCGVNVTGVALDLPDSMEKGTTLTAVPAYTFDGATPESAALPIQLCVRCGGLVRDLLLNFSHKNHPARAIAPGRGFCVILVFPHSWLRSHPRRCRRHWAKSPARSPPAQRPPPLSTRG